MNFETLRETLKRILDQAKTPVLAWSGGNDSNLILATLRDMNANVAVLQRRDLWTKEQKAQADKFIKDWNLTVYSYPPVSLSFIGDGEQISLVSEYAIGGFKVPAVMDVADGTKCIADLPKQRMEYSPFQWTDYIVGTKATDRHYAFGEQPLTPDSHWQVGDVNFHAPLYDWSDAQVLDALKELDIEPKTTEEGNLEYCSKCLHGVDVFCPKDQKYIPAIDWNPKLNLENFRKAYSPQ
jgi:hypothetical protein